MTACVICASRRVANHCIACVTASTSMVRLDVVTLWVPLSSCTVLPPCLTVNTQPLWLSRLCRSRCHVACCWLRQALVLLHWFFQLAIHGSECLGSLTAESCSRAWTQLGVFPSPLLAWALRDWTHAGLIVLLDPSTTCLLPVYTPFLLWQHRGVDSLDSTSHWDTPWLAPPYVLFPWMAGPVGSAWSQWVCPLLFLEWLSWLRFVLCRAWAR